MRKPIHYFEGLSSLGIDKVPNDAHIVVKDNGLGKAVNYIKVANTGMLSTSTITDFLADTALYNVFRLGELVHHSDDGVKYGWCLPCRVVDEYEAYGVLGQGAFDITASEVDAVGIGALGKFSFSGGYLSKAVGIASFSFGSKCETVENYSVAMGTGCVAEQEASIALGRDCKAFAGASVALGNGCNSYGSDIVLGAYNIGHVANIRALEVGIGTGGSNTVRKNALEIFKTGKVIAPEQTITLTTEPRQLVTKEYVDTQVSNKQDIRPVVTYGDFVSPAETITLGLTTSDTHIINVIDSMTINSTGLVGNRGTLLINRNPQLTLESEVIFGPEFEWLGGSSLDPTAATLARVDYFVISPTRVQLLLVSED